MTSPEMVSVQISCPSRETKRIRVGDLFMFIIGPGSEPWLYFILSEPRDGMCSAFCITPTFGYTTFILTYDGVVLRSIDCAVD